MVGRWKGESFDSVPSEQRKLKGSSLPSSAYSSEPLLLATLAASAVMDVTGVAVLCYWNGKVKTEKYDVAYEGEDVKVMPIKLHCGTTYTGLLGKIYTATGIDRKDYEFNIICRFPISSKEYRPVPIKNDEAVQLMLEVPSRSGMFCAEIYMEKQPSSISTVEANASTDDTNKVLLGYGNDEIESERHKCTFSVIDFSASLSNLAMPTYFYIGETSSRRSNNGYISDHSKMEGRKWEELNMDCLVNVFRRVGIESLVLDVPFVCKSWYKASLDPRCWEHLIFPKWVKSGVFESGRLADRLAKELHENYSAPAFIKFVVARSQRCATQLKLPTCCTPDPLEYVVNETPLLKALSLHADLFTLETIIIPRLISKWKNLEMLAIESSVILVEILPQISLHCKKFVKLCAPGTHIRKAQATAIVTSLPNLKYLVIKGSTIMRDNLVMILKGCRELQGLDARECFGFEEDDAVILALASHIPTFTSEGSILGDYYDQDRYIDDDYYYYD